MVMRLDPARLKPMAGSADGGFGARRLYEHDYPLETRSDQILKCSIHVYIYI